MKEELNFDDLKSVSGGGNWIKGDKNTKYAYASKNKLGTVCKNVQLLDGRSCSYIVVQKGKHLRWKNESDGSCVLFVQARPSENPDVIFEK